MFIAGATNTVRRKTTTSSLFVDCPYFPGVEPPATVAVDIVTEAAASVALDLFSMSARECAQETQTCGRATAPARTAVSLNGTRTYEVEGEGGGGGGGRGRGRGRGGNER